MPFSAQILIDSVDHVAQLTGEVVVNIGEGEARIARFSLDPMPGPIDPYSYIGQAVVINYVDDGTSALLFTGKVNTADYDIDAGLMLFVCSDLLQEAFETVGRKQAAALITEGVWSDKIFRTTKDNWDFAQQKMSTYPGSLDKAPDGTLRITPWAAKGSPDFTYTAANIDSGTLKIDKLAERRSIVNSVKITYTSVFQLLRQREQSLSWQAEYPSPGNWVQYLDKTFKLPERQAIESALNDWKIKSISYVDLPPSGVYTYLGGVEHIWITNEYTNSQCQGFSAVVAARWRQDIAVEYQITVKNQASIDQHELLETEQSYTVSHKSNSQADDFIQFKDYQTPQGQHVLTLTDVDEYQDTTQADDSLPQLVVMGIAKTKILDSHRQNRISFECALNAGIDVDKTVAIDHPKLTAKGKVASIEHRMNFDEGFAITHCVIAVTLPNVSAQADDSITRSLTPAKASPPDLTPPGTPPSWPALGQYIGFDDGVPPDDPTWNGWVTNYDGYIGFDTPIIYPIRFAVESPALDKTDFKAQLNSEWPLQSQLVKSGGSFYQRVLFGGEIVNAGDSVQLFDGDTAVGSPVTVTNTHINNGYIDIAATETRQDEHSLTYIVASTFNVAIPQDDLTISK